MYKIGLTEMQIFLYVAKYQNFSKAANALYISQPTVTKWVKHLETELDIQLFVRTSKSVTLTPAGEQLKERWKFLLAELEASIHDAQEIATSSLSTIRIGALYGYDFEKFVSAYILPFQEQYPGTKIEFNIYTLHELNDHMENLDLIFSNNLEFTESTDYTWLKLDEIPFYLAVSKQNPLSQKDVVCVEDFQNERSLIFPPSISSGAMKAATKAYSSLGVTPNFASVENIPSQMMKISQNQGVAILGASTIKGYEQEISLLKVKDFPLDFYRVLIYRPQKLSATARKFCSYLTTHFFSQSTE